MILRLYKVVALILHILLGILITAIVTGLLRISSRDQRFKKLSHWWLIRVCKVLSVHTKIIGTPAKQTVLYVANHISWLDIPLLAGLINPHFLSKAEIRSWPLIGWLAEKGGTLFIKRGNREAAASASEEMMKSLNGDDDYAGHSVLFFPEGTTTNGHDVKRFKSRLFDVAIDAEMPVQPIVLYYPDEQHKVNPFVPFTGDQSLVNSLWHILGARKIQVEVYFLELILSEGKSRRELAAISEERVKNKLKQCIDSVGSVDKMLY